MADGHSPDHVHCLECWSRRQMLPPENLARVTMTEDWSPEDMAFEPRPMTQEQAVAAELMTAAIGRYWKAFGVDLTGARLNALLLVLRERAKATRANARILQARAIPTPCAPSKLSLPPTIRARRVTMLRSDTSNQRPSNCRRRGDETRLHQDPSYGRSCCAMASACG